MLYFLSDQSTASNKEKLMRFLGHLAAGDGSLFHDDGFPRGTIAEDAAEFLRFVRDARIDESDMQAMQWPASKEVRRNGDMTPQGDSYMRVGLDSDNDVYVHIVDNIRNRDAGLEFCSSGNGCGKSPHTRKALIGLMIAMELDEKESPTPGGSRNIAR